MQRCLKLICQETFHSLTYEYQWLLISNSSDLKMQAKYDYSLPDEYMKMSNKWE